MDSAREIEETVLRLSAAELAAFREWFTEFTADAWDRRTELDVTGAALADESYQLLRRDPKHPSLRFKRAGRFWSVRVGLPYRTRSGITAGSLVGRWVTFGKQGRVTCPKR